MGGMAMRDDTGAESDLMSIYALFPVAFFNLIRQGAPLGTNKHLSERSSLQYCTQSRSV